MENRFNQNCTTLRRDLTLVFKENRSKIIFENPHRLEVIQVEVDGCQITEGERCDWLVIGPNAVEYFIELKGTHIKKAFDQIASSVRELSNSLRLRVCISGRKIPSKANNNLAIMKAKFRKKYPNTIFYINSGDVRIKI